MKILFIAFTLLLSSCCHHISVHTDYLTEERLASFFVGTPDPNLLNPVIGQRLIVTWCFSRQEYKQYDNLFLLIRVRFHNQEEIELKHPVESLNGYYTYQVDDCKFHKTGGIITYKAELRNNNTIIETWLHPLWEELIHFNNP